MPAKKSQPALIIMLEDTNRDKIHRRLTDDLSLDEKNRLYRAFLKDTIYTCLTLTNTVVEVNYPSEETKTIVNDSVKKLDDILTPRLQKILRSSGFVTISSTGESQGDRLKQAFKRAFKNGYSEVVLIGCVTPTLSKNVIQNAYRLLKKHDVVFGPTLEGSYYLIGLSIMIDDVFDKIDWTSDQAIYSQMVSMVSEKSLNWNELDLWYDLRQSEDFEFLVRDINFFRQIGDEKSAICTEDVLNEVLKKIS
jgi:glycosyltransferase A (GT-A) superfamily protein (DUF2064 family)